MVPVIDHVNIVVDDIDSMTRFYTDVIGMSVLKRGELSGDWVDRLVGLKGMEAKVVILSGVEGANIELIKYLAPEGVRHDRLAQPNTKGLRHIAFRVSSIHGIVEACVQRGIGFRSEIQEVPTVQVPEEGMLRKRLVYFEDPEGTLLEFCSYEP